MLGFKDDLQMINNVFNRNVLIMKNNDSKCTPTGQQRGWLVGVPQ